jgi:maltooligosyltrehalose trehalohydrolase
MPFGAELQDDGSVRFRLWAPAAERVDVCLSGGDAGIHCMKPLPMAIEPDGWFSLTTGLATAGSRYRFRINGNLQLPDPASRFQPQDVHGPSEVIDPGAWEWQDTNWNGRAWEEAVFYEVHVGTFTPRGSFAAVTDKLDYLVELGITALELMPVADFPGTRNWGYDGAYLFAPDSRYGHPDDLKALVDAAHARGLMVFLDVVYNHFGPEGNYLHLYAPQFFTETHLTPWGAGINYDGKSSYWVRQFFIHNALYWLEEFYLDGLRFDAVHAIQDDTRPDILSELAECVRRTFGEGRRIHLVLENDNNASRYLSRDASQRPQYYAAQWNDDIHHCLHVLLTGETDGYYMDYARSPVFYLARCLAEGFAYQGEPSAYRENAPRGEPSARLPPTAFVSFLQNHDQVGNRAFGERINVLSDPAPLRAALALLLLAPSPPLIFMGQEWGCTRPFLFFCDFGAELANKVVAGRRDEFSRFPQFRDPAARARIPDPMDRLTFEAAVLDWDASDHPQHKHWLHLHRELLAIRQRELIPRLHNAPIVAKSGVQLDAGALSANWTLGDGSGLILFANLADRTYTGVHLPAYPVLYSTHASESGQIHERQLQPWSVVWYLHRQEAVP